MKYSELDKALALHNDVPQGLSSSIFSTDMHEVEKFLSVMGSDCGIANVNIGPSGAEIGGAFGGEKGNRRRPRRRVGRMEGLYAPGHQHHQFRPRPSARPGRPIRYRLSGSGEKWCPRQRYQLLR